MQNVDVPPGSNVLITGVNGLIASNIVSNPNLQSKAQRN